jgi:hypothetical protein
MVSKVDLDYDFRLEGPDGNESFRLYCNSIDIQDSSNFIIDNLKSAAELVGYNFELNKAEWTLTITSHPDVISDADYPKSFQYANNELGYLLQLRRALRDWAFIEGTATLVMEVENGQHTFDVFISDVGANASVRSASDNPDEWDITVNLQETNVQLI